MEESLKIRGVVTAKLAPETRESKQGKTFTKTTFAIVTDGKYPKTIAFNDFGTANINNRNIGDEIIVSFNPESREYKGKYYTELVAYKIELVAAVAPVNTVSAEALSPTAGVSFDSERSEAPANDDTSLPF